MAVGIIFLAAVGIIWAAEGKKSEEGPALYWGFDEGSGQTVKDLSGNHNDGIVGGKVSWVDGVKGKAVKIEGKDGAVFCVDTERWDAPTTNITIEFWLNPVKWAEANNIINKGWAKGWGIEPHYYGERFHFCANIDDKRQDAEAPIAFPTNKWTHVALIFNGKAVTIYVNGDKKAICKVSKTGADNNAGWTPSGQLSGILDSAGEPLQVGGISPAIFCIDEFKIYNRVLTQGEIAEASLRKDQVVLTEGGKPNSVIIVDEHAPVVTMFAAQEMQKYLEKVSGVKLPIAAVNSITNITELMEDNELILIGNSVVAKNLGVDIGDLKPDGFRIVSRPGALVIAGNDDKRAKPEYPFGSYGGCGSAGTIYGVYRFLESLGVRWYFPGEIGEVVPHKKDIRVEKTDIVSAPYFVWRNCEAPPGADYAWMRRIGFGGSVYIGGSGHSFDKLYLYGYIHPEWFALRADGSRGKNLCLSNPEVQALIIKKAKKYFQRKDADIFRDFTIMENDGSPTPCVCPECKKKVTPEEGFFGETSDYWAEIAVKTADAIKKEFPDRMISIGAYNGQVRPPLRIKQLPANVSVQIAKSRLYLWSEEGKEITYSEIINGWLALKPAAVSFFEYYNFDCWSGGKRFGVPALATEMISSDIKRLKQMSEKSGIPFLGEMIFSGDSRPGKDAPDRMYWVAPDLYVTAKLLWDPDLPVKSLMEEFYRLYFGPAETPMKAFYERLEEVWSSGKWGRSWGVGVKMSQEEMKKAGGYFGNNPWEILFTPGILKELAGQLAKAKEKAVESPYKERIEMVAKQFGTTLKYAEKGGGKISAEEMRKVNTLW